MNHSLGSRKMYESQHHETHVSELSIQKVLQHHSFHNKSLGPAKHVSCCHATKTNDFPLGLSPLLIPQSQRWTAKLRDGNTATAAGRMAGRRDTLTVAEKWRKCDVAHIEKGQWNRDDDYTGDLVGLPNSDQFSKEKSMIILGQYPKLVSCSTYMVRILYSNRPSCSRTM